MRDRYRQAATVSDVRAARASAAAPPTATRADAPAGVRFAAAQVSRAKAGRRASSARPAPGSFHSQLLASIGYSLLFRADTSSSSRGWNRHRSGPLRIAAGALVVPIVLS